MPGKVRIIHEELHPAEPEKPKKRGKKAPREEFAPAEQGLDDVFAEAPEMQYEKQRIETPPKALQETAPMQAAPSIPSADARLTPESPNISSGASGVPPLPPLSGSGDTNPEQREQSLESSLGVNLIPEDMLASTGKQNRIVALGFFSIFSALTVALFFVILSIFQQRITSQIERNQELILQRDQQIAQLASEKKNVIDFHRRALDVVERLDEHIYWTKFLSGLEKYTVDTVSVRSVSADKAGRVSLSMRAKDFRSVARQLIAFEEADDFVSTVSITAATSAESGGIPSVDFSASITLVDSVLYRDSSGGPEFFFE